MESTELRQEIRKRYEVVEKTLCMDFGQLNHHKEKESFPNETEMEMVMKDNEEFEQLRIANIEEIISINKKIKYKKNIKKIKKEAIKNMIDGPAIAMYNLKDAILVNKKQCKDITLFGKPYHSDSENPGKTTEEEENNAGKIRNERTSSLAGRLNSFDE